LENPKIPFLHAVKSQILAVNLALNESNPKRLTTFWKLCIKIMHKDYAIFHKIFI